MIQFRVASSDDINDIVDLWHREGGPTRHAGSLREATVLFERDPEAILTAVSDGQIVGAVIAGWDGWRFHIYRLAVDSSSRRLGIARRLMDLAHQRADKVGAARVDAMVDPANSAAIAFWESIGYGLDRDSRWSLLRQG